MLNFKKLNEIKGDASLRKFYRNKNNHSIVVYAKKEKVKNLLIYDAVNKILNKNKILAPKLFKENYKKNYIEIQDFGDLTILKILKRTINEQKVARRRSCPFGQLNINFEESASHHLKKLCETIEI